jgi:hypothetical protein
MQKHVPQDPRDRGRPLKAFVTPGERLTIESKASAAGLSVSSYLRAAALGQRIESALDQRAILDLLKLNGDQGRLGGLLKLWLSSRAGEGAGAADVRRVLHQIEALQIKLRAVIDSL